MQHVIDYTKYRPIISKSIALHLVCSPDLAVSILLEDYHWYIEFMFALLVLFGAHILEHFLTPDYTGPHRTCLVLSDAHFFQNSHASDMSGASKNTDGHRTFPKKTLDRPVHRQGCILTLLTFI